MVLLRRVSSIHGPAVFVAFFGRYRLKVTDQPAAADVGFYSPRNKRLMMSQDERARLSPSVQQVTRLGIANGHTGCQSRLGHGPRLADARRLRGLIAVECRHSRLLD